MTNKPATTEDAQLVLRLYELRREDEMRKARAWYASEFLPNSFDEVKPSGSMANTLTILISEWLQPIGIWPHRLSPAVP
jgi:hypothetical protein